MTQPQTLRASGITAARDYQDLPAWQKAMALAERIFGLSTGTHASELASMARVSAIAIPAHIAAASAKHNEHGIGESYSAAQAAAAELFTQLTLSQRLNQLADAESLLSELDEVTRLLVGMKHGLKIAAKDEARAERETAKLDREHAERVERAERKPKRDFDRPRRDERPDREERQYKKPRRDFDKPYGDRKPRGEGGEYKPRKPRGEGGEYKPRRDFGDKPRGDRKPYGDKPRGDFKKGPRKPYRD